MKKKIVIVVVVIVLFIFSFLLVLLSRKREVPQEKRWGIYSLNLNSSRTELLFSSDRRISFLDLNHVGDTVAFSQENTNQIEESEEIFSLQLSDSTLKQITDNDHRDIYPVWSPDDQQIIFLSWRTTLGIYMIDENGENEHVLYDSKYHDADLDWGKEKIVFTRNSQIWIIDIDGSHAQSVTNPPNAGEKNNTNLPFGDYDPRINPDGTKILFSRLVDDSSIHGNYDHFLINIDGSNEVRLTDTGFSQGIAQWSPDGEKIVYSVAAIRDEGKYDIYLMNADGSENRNITPEYFPKTFLCYSPTFSIDSKQIFFVGEWWE